MIASESVRRPSERLHGLDTLRAAAIVAVMLFHLNGHLPDALRGVARFGWMGVDLFFVLSGFLIGSQLFRPWLAGGAAPSIMQFYRRRAYRILPAFFVVLLLYIWVPAWREAPGLQAWWQFATFTENFFIDYGNNQAFSHAWSLCVEEHFYLVLPLLTALLVRKPAMWKAVSLLLLFAFLGVGLRAFVLLHQLRPLGTDADSFPTRYIETMYYPTYVRLDGLLAGLALALVRVFRPAWWQQLRERGHLLTAAGLILLAFALWCTLTRMTSVTGRAVAGDLFGYPMLGVSFALLTASAMSHNGLLARVHVPGARLLATLAFSLYLTHKEAVHLLLLAFPALPDNTWSAIPFEAAACLSVAAALYLLVERPFLRLRDSRKSKRGHTADLNLQARIDPAL